MFKYPYSSNDQTVYLKYRDELTQYHKREPSRLVIQA